MYSSKIKILQKTHFYVWFIFYKKSPGLVHDVWSYLIVGFCCKNWRNISYLCQLSKPRKPTLMFNLVHHGCCQHAKIQKSTKYIIFRASKTHFCLIWIQKIPVLHALIRADFGTFCQANHIFEFFSLKVCVKNVLRRPAGV